MQLEWAAHLPGWSPCHFRSVLKETNLGPRGFGVALLRGGGSGASCFLCSRQAALSGLGCCPPPALTAAPIARRLRAVPALPAAPTRNAAAVPGDLFLLHRSPAPPSRCPQGPECAVPPCPAPSRPGSAGSRLSIGAVPPAGALPGLWHRAGAQPGTSGLCLQRPGLGVWPLCPVTAVAPCNAAFTPSPAGTSSGPVSQKRPYGQSSSLFVPLGYYSAMKNHLPGGWPPLAPQISHWNKFSWYL